MIDLEKSSLVPLFLSVLEAMGGEERVLTSEWAAWQGSDCSCHFLLLKYPSHNSVNALFCPECVHSVWTLEKMDAFLP